MHHAHADRRPATRLHTVGRSPLREVDEAFLDLARAPHPLTLPAYLVCDDPDVQAWPVDQVRARLAHPSTRPELRERTWAEVVRRAQVLGEPWTLVAVGMTVPVLRRMLARLARPAYLERAEVEQEALAAVAVALAGADPADPQLARVLFSAADRPVHRLVRGACRRTVREVGDPAVHLGRLHAPLTPYEGCDGQEDELTVLARAVQGHVVDRAEAQLIARTRLGKEPMGRLAVERGVSVRQLYRHRAAAEQHLAAHLQHLNDQDRA
jgi:hypothetical protein